MFKKLVIIGVGLIGGSFSLALKKAGAVTQVIGIDRNKAALVRAEELAIIDTSSEIQDALQDADLVFLAVPVGQMGASLESIKPFLPAKTLVTDGGSTKTDVVAIARQVLGPQVNQFIPGHPIAGSEASGPDAASADLFKNHKAILTPLPENAPQDVARVARAWELCGMTVRHIDPVQHDRIFATVSHLPHLLAYTLVDMVSHQPDADFLFDHAGRSFRDMTRIAQSSPPMWRDICLANRSALLQQIDDYTARLQHLRSLVENEDGEAMHALFSQTRQARLKL